MTLRAADSTTLSQLQQRFEAILPVIVGHAHKRLHFLHGEARDEAVQETLALAWAAYRKLALAGRDPDALIGGIAAFSVHQVLRGDCLAGRGSVKDVLSPNGRRHRPVRTLPTSDDGPAAPEVVTAARSRSTGPAEQATFNVDLHEWLAGLDDRQREVAQELAAGLSNAEVGARRGKSRGWTNLVRRQLRQSWDQFNADSCHR